MGELGSQSPVSYEEDFEDLSSNVDLYVFNDQMLQGYRGVNINSRHNEESLGELYRKDDIDVSNQEHTAPVYFQSLSLDSPNYITTLDYQKSVAMNCQQTLLNYYSN